MCVLLLPPVPGESQSEATTLRSYDGRSIPAEQVRISVPERRAHPGRSISIAALRIRGTAARPGRPIVFLMGGPGIPGSVMAPIPPYFTLFQRLREIGDVVIPDQRGIGRSEPGLDCSVTSAPPEDALMDGSALMAASRRQVAACAEQWRAKGDDPTAYNTIESADDIDDLCRSLGYDKIDLLAFSYGTRLALAVVARHEAHVGRMVLQGVDGPGQVVKVPSAVARKLQRIGEMLAKDPDWKGPTDLMAAARTARSRLADHPATVTVTGHRNGQPVKLAVGRGGFDAIAALSLNDVRLPALLVSVAAGDDRVLARMAEATLNRVAAGTVGLMGRAVDCAADRPAARWALARHESEAAPFGMPIDNAVLTDDFCRAVGYAKPAVEFARPLRSGVPALLLTGTLDATNPVENAREVARGLSRAVLLDIENAPHEALPETAVQDVVLEFFRGGDVQGRSIVADAPRFLSVEDAAKEARGRGGR